MRQVYLACITCIFFLPSIGQESVRYQTKYGLESLINNQIANYQFSTPNLFRLATYAELKGKYSAANQSLNLDFGPLGKITFFEKNCLLHTPSGQVFYLNKGANPENQRISFEQEVNKMFEHISLMAHKGRDPNLVHFVDRNLLKKNIEPFEKVYTRHILINYGRFDPEKRQVLFDTRELPQQSYQYFEAGDHSLVKRQSSPLRLVLDSVNLRGYYVRAGGYVYVNDVKRKIAYATGEEYEYNVSAFKLFIQQLFVQTTQYIVEQTYAAEAASRQPGKGITVSQPAKPAPSKTHAARTAGPSSAIPSSHGRVRQPVEPLYDKYTWIPTMLARLEAHQIKVTDPDILCYLVDQPYFDRIYRILSKEDKQKVDQYIALKKEGNYRNGKI